MDIVRVFNGLGNQMSQYAFYLSKKKLSRWGTSWMYLPRFFQGTSQHNGFELDSVFGIKRNRIREFVFYRVFVYANHSRGLRQYVFSKFVREYKEKSNYDFDISLLKNGSKMKFNFFLGGWHSEKYFKQIREKLLDVYKFDTQKLSDSSMKWSLKIKNDAKSCSIHVRRGDYLSDSIWSGICTITYYQEAIGKIEQLKGSQNFFIFSDDIDWCRKYFVGDNFFFVDCNKRENAWQDMYLMSICKNHINANSTFSWWGSWLCTFPESITIVPSKFMKNRATKDIYPSSWIKIDTVS